MSADLSNDEMLDLLRQAFSSGNWFQFPLQFLDLMPTQEALLLSYLNNHANKCDKHGDWFYCHSDKIESDLRISKPTQTRGMRKLKVLQFIDTKTEGMPARRLIRINWQQVAKQLHKITFPE